MIKKKPTPMTGEQFQAAIDALGLSQMAASRFLKVAPRTARRYISGETVIPHGVALLLALMIERKITPAQLGHEPMEHET